MKLKRNLLVEFRRWKASRVELLQQVASLTKENEQLREKLSAVRLAKDQAVRHAEDRGREKEALRAKLNAQKKASELHSTVVAELGAKVTELRTELEKMKRAKKK